MSFELIEKSRSRGEPIQLYLFRYAVAATAYYGYTDADQQVLYDARTYRPVSIERGAITSSGTLDKASLQVNLAHNSEVAELFRIYPPSEVVTLTIFEGHQNDPDGQFRAVWAGRVLSCARNGSKATLTCEPVSTSMRRAGLRRNYQYGCPHALYGQGCFASKIAATVTRDAGVVGNSSITFGDGWAAVDPQKYVGGLAEWSTGFEQGEIRTILRVDHNTLLLSGPTTKLRPGMDVQLSLGCNRQMGDCETLHNNIQNFGGQPYIPTKNPIGMTNHFY